MGFIWFTLLITVANALKIYLKWSQDDILSSLSSYQQLFLLWLFIHTDSIFMMFFWSCRGIQLWIFLSGSWFKTLADKHTKASWNPDKSAESSGSFRLATQCGEQQSLHAQSNPEISTAQDHISFVHYCHLLHFVIFFLPNYSPKTSEKKIIIIIWISAAVTKCPIFIFNSVTKHTFVSVSK